MKNWTLCCIITITIVLPVFILFLRRNISISRRDRLPPGPRGWPVFGNMFDLGAMPHRTLAGLKKIYGPVVWLRIGSIDTMVVQSSKAAAELFKNHDLSFVDRNITDAMEAHNFHKGSVSLASYGTYWREMKRMLSVKMVGNKKIIETVPIRRKCVQDMISWIRKEAINGGKETQGIVVSRFVLLSLFNMIGNMIFSRDLVTPDSAKGMEIFTAMIDLMEWSGHPNIVDLFPCLRWLDPQGLRQNTYRDMGKTMEIVSKLVTQCLNERGQLSAEKKNDYLQMMLDHQAAGKDERFQISYHEINIHIVEVFLAGSETASGTIEWAMVELINNPTTLLKLKAELEEVVGMGHQVEEDDIDNLKYLQAVIKETLRLHPPLPFLVPRRTSQDTNFMGYNIHKNTQVFVNVFAIGRDPENWDDPEIFKPERFLNSDIDFKGQHYELLPFGGGRRICPGIPLAHRMLPLAIGSMMHEFDWDVHYSETCKIKDMRERLGIVARKVDPLIAIPRPHIRPQI